MGVRLAGLQVFVQSLVGSNRWCGWIEIDARLVHFGVVFESLICLDFGETDHTVCPDWAFGRLTRASDPLKLS